MVQFRTPHPVRIPCRKEDDSRFDDSEVVTASHGTQQISNLILLFSTKPKPTQRYRTGICCILLLFKWSLLLFDRSWPFLDSGDVAGSEVLQHSRPSLGSQMPAPGIVRLDASSHIWMNVWSVHSIPIGKSEYWKWIISHWKWFYVCGLNMGSFFLVVLILAKTQNSAGRAPTYVCLSSCTHPTVEILQQSL